MINNKSRNWLLIGSIAITIGSLISATESLLQKGVDSLLPKTERVLNFSRPGTLTFLSTNNNILQKLGPATREKVARGQMPKIVKNAFIAAEDRRFQYHNGVDIWGIGRALITNIRKKSLVEGGSTITQQLARTVYLNQDRTLTRKLKEAALAYKLERQLSKEYILEQYLNNVYLGSGAYGVSDAAWVYFKKEPNQLSLEEVALIAGLPPAPSYYSPLINPDLAIERRTIVLVKMKNEGFISKKDFSEAVKKPMQLRPATPKYFDSEAPFFTTWASQKLPLILTPDQLEIGGLSIKTSLNLKWQRKAQEIITKFSPEDTEGALVSIEPQTGLVKTLVGGKNFKENEFNRATQALRSPGSTFKIFPYAAAISEGYKPEDIFIDAPSCWGSYCPKNFGNKYLGRVSLSKAFAKSLNTVAVKLLDEVGFEKVIETANKFGIGNKRKLGKYYPLAIGAYEQTLLDMTSAYAGLTNKGLYIQPIPFEEIRGPDNKLLWSHKIHHKKPVRAINQNTAKTLNWMLKQVVKKGTGKSAQIKDLEVAGKTGTSEGGRDLWFIGSIPEISTGIWFGNDDNSPTNSGSSSAAKAWKEFILGIRKDLSFSDAFKTDTEV